MTRKNNIRKSKIKNKIKITKINKNNRKTIKAIKGGGPAMMIANEATGGLRKGLITMFQYGFISIITAPIYLLALIANLPLNTANNVSGKRLNEVKSGVIHNQLYKYLFYGYNLKDLKEDDYKFPQGSRYKLQGNKVFVECDDCKSKKPATGLPTSLANPGLDSIKKMMQFGGGVDVKASAKKILGVSGIADVLGLLSHKEKMQHILSNFFDYLNNLQMKEPERRDLIHKLILSINNKDAIIKCIIVFNTLFQNDAECAFMKKEIDDNVNTPKYTFMERPTISRIPNPFMIPGQTKRDLKKSIKCITGHLLYKEFGPETLTEECMPKCPKCTLRNSLGRLVDNYTASIRQILKGTNKDLELLSEIFYNIFNQNFYYAGTSSELKMKKIKDEFISSLENLPSYSEFNQWKTYPKLADLNKINKIVINSKYVVLDSSPLKDVLSNIIKEEDKKKDIYKKIFGEEVYDKFKTLLCKYDIINELKKRYVALSFESYYSLVGNIIKYPKEDTFRVAYLTWCNKFLNELYEIHNIKDIKLEADYLFGENEINKLVINSKSIAVNDLKK